MAYREKARVVGHVICAGGGTELICLKGKTGRVLERKYDGTVAVMMIQGRRYHIPVDMIESLTSRKEAATHV